MRIYRGFVCATLGEFGRGFMRICRDLIRETLGGFTRLWERIHEDLQDFGRGFARFARLWERIHEDLCGFVGIHGRICKTLAEDS